MASCSATLWCIAQGPPNSYSIFRQKKAPMKGLFRFASRSVLASPEATTRIGTVNAIEITVYSYMVIVKQKSGTGLNAENDRAQAQTAYRVSSVDTLAERSKCVIVLRIVDARNGMYHQATRNESYLRALRRLRAENHVPPIGRLQDRGFP